MLADVHHCVDPVLVTQPEVERQIRMWRHKVRVVIAGVVALLARARRLNADEYLAAAPA